MNLHETVTLHFLLSAAQCRTQLPVMTDNEKVIVAKEPSSGFSELWPIFQTLPLRLGSGWTVAKVDGDFIIAFCTTDFPSPQGAFNYHYQHVERFTWIDYTCEVLGRRGEKAALLGTIITRKMLGEDGKACCMVCLESVALGEEVGQLACGHWYHQPCISSWLDIRDTCPSCLQTIE
jgi:hypothetical protein